MADAEAVLAFLNGTDVSASDHTQVTDIEGESVEAPTQTGTHAGLAEQQALTARWHPIAMCWPLIDGPEFQKLCASLLKFGQQHDIIRYQGLTLDGRNRERGCIHVGITPRYRDFTGTYEEAIELATDCNDAARRHLTEGQRVAIAVKLTNLKQGRRTKPADVPVCDGEPKPAHVPVSQAQAAKTMKVGERSVRKGAKVERKAPDVFKAMAEGRMSVSAAEDLADAPADQQNAALKQIAAGVDAAVAVKAVVSDGTKKPKATPTPKATPVEDTDIVEATAQLYMSWTSAQRQRFHDRLGELEKIEAQAQPLS